MDSVCALFCFRGSVISHHVIDAGADYDARSSETPCADLIEGAVRHQYRDATNTDKIILKYFQIYLDVCFFVRIFV